jgi:hypothetical protein
MASVSRLSMSSPFGELLLPLILLVETLWAHSTPSRYSLPAPTCLRPLGCMHAHARPLSIPSSSFARSWSPLSFRVASLPPHISISPPSSLSSSSTTRSLLTTSLSTCSLLSQLLVKSFRVLSRLFNRLRVPVHYTLLLPVPPTHRTGGLPLNLKSLLAIRTLPRFIVPSLVSPLRTPFDPLGSPPT